MPLAQRDEEVQALPADRSHHTFASGICHFRRVTECGAKLCWVDCTTSTTWKRSLHYSNSSCATGASSASRTVRKKLSELKGFRINGISGSRSPCRAAASSAYPDVYKTLTPGLRQRSFSTSTGPLM